MSLWLLITILCSAAAVGLSIPLIRRFESVNASTMDEAVYKEQLQEAERDLHAGTINGPEAVLAKVEIQRRLASLEKNVTEARPITKWWRNAALIATASFVILGSVSLYNIMGSPDLPSAVSQHEKPTAPSTTPTPPEVAALVAKLLTHLKANPKDAEGWRMLGWSQFNLQKYPQSADAYAKALSIDPTNTDYKSAYAESLVQMAQGIVTPKARVLIAEVLAKQPKDSRGRFYDALAYEQSGDQSAALDRWLALLADTPPDAGWREDVKRRISDLAKATGRDVSAALAMANGDQKNMINAMVERLAAKLAANPNDLEGWLRLMHSYQVLGDSAKARNALATALSTFAAEKASTDKIKAAASELGLN